MKKDLRYYWQRLGTLAIFVLLMIIMGIFSPQYFLSRNNIIQIFLQSSINVLIAIGVFFPILIAGIDLSVGSVLGLTGMVSALLMANGWDMWLALLVGGVLLGAFLGLLNGTLVVATKLHPFIITLGSNMIFRGLT